MCEQDQFEKDRQEFEQRGQVTRRQFGMMIGAGVALMLPSVVNAAEVTESEITITTPDGVADCYFVHPAKGTAPAIIIWPDIFGLRPAFKKMGKRLAESGYAVLVVNPFYRSKKAADMVGGTTVPIAELRPLASALNETTAATDSKAFVSWLDSQSRHVARRWCVSPFITPKSRNPTVLADVGTVGHPSDLTSVQNHPKKRHQKAPDRVPYARSKSIARHTVFMGFRWRTNPR
jgi:hypothetical protein